MLMIAPEVVRGAPPVARPDADDAGPPAPGRAILDRIAPLVYLVGGLYLTARLWLDPNHRLQQDNIQDQGFFQFVLAHAARSVTHLSNPLFESQVNWPGGVNMMANTSILGLAVPLTPVTLLFGPGVAYAVLVTLAPVLTATSWYFVLSRHVVRSRPVAFLAAGFCGFAPGLVSQSNGHPNVAAQFLVPLILLQVAKLRDDARPVRRGLILGLLVAYQAFINEEVLLLTAVAASLMVLVFALARRAEARAALGGAVRAVGTAGGLVAVLLAYPLWFHFFGPQHYGAIPALSVSYYSDAGSFFNYPGRSIGGSATSGYFMRSHPAEQNAFFGWPLLILALVIAIWQWRRLLVRMATVAAVFCGAMSLGPRVMVYNHNTGIPGPFRLVNWLPVIDSLVPVRIVLMAVPAVGVLLAIGLDQLRQAPRQAGSPRIVWFAAYLAALLPLFPLPLRTIPAPREPHFISAGTWRQYVGSGQSVVLVPVPAIGRLDGQRWSAAQQLDMPIAGGYFLGPGPGRRAVYGAVPRPTTDLLANIEMTGAALTITAADRQHMVDDLRYWRAGVVVLDPGAHHAALIRAAVTDLLGAQPRLIDGAWVWDV